MKRKAIIIVVIFIWISIFFIDFLKVKTGNEPIFTIRMGFDPKDSEVHHIGLLYIYTQDVRIGFSEPLRTSTKVDLAIWFLPGIEVYSYAH